MRDWLMGLAVKRKRAEDAGPRYGDANDRCMAAVIDVVLLFLLLGNFSSWLTEKIYFAFHQLPPTPAMQIASMGQLAEYIWQTRYPWAISNLLIFLLIGVGIITCQMLYGTTPGKWLLGLKIVRRDTLEPPARWRYVLRFFAYFFSVAPLMVGLFWMSFNKERRTFHDYIAGTVVIHTRPRGWYYAQVKRGFRWVRTKISGSAPLEQPVGEPAAGERHEDGKNSVD